MDISFVGFEKKGRDPVKSRGEASPTPVLAPPCVGVVSFVVSPPVRDLLLCAKDLMLEANLRADNQSRTLNEWVRERAR